MLSGIVARRGAFVGAAAKRQLHSTARKNAVVQGQYAASGVETGAPSKVSLLCDDCGGESMIM